MMQGKDRKSASDNFRKVVTGMFPFFFVFLLLVFSSCSDMETDTSRDGETPPSESLLVCMSCHSDRASGYAAFFSPFPSPFRSTVDRAKARLNFSNWENLSDGRRRLRAQRIKRMLDSEEMPPTLFSRFHTFSPTMRREALRWAEQMGRSR